MTTPCEFLRLKEPTAEFRLWPFGRCITEKGEYELTPEAAEAIMDRHVKRGRPQIPIHIEGMQSPAAGWGELEMRKDGAWLVNVTWTHEGLKAAKSALGFLAPSIEHKDKDDLVSEVNWPPRIVWYYGPHPLKPRAWLESWVEPPWWSPKKLRKWAEAR